MKHIWFSGHDVRAVAEIAGASFSGSWSMPDFALPAPQLLHTIKSISDQGLKEISFEVKDTTVVIAGGELRATLRKFAPAQGDDASSFILRDPPVGQRTKVTPEWWSGVKRLGFSACRDDTKMPLRGIFWTDGGVLLSTDTYRITTLIHAKAERIAAPVRGGVLIPDHLISRLGSAIRDACEIGLEGDSIMWAFMPGGFAYGSLPAGDFPVAGCSAQVKSIREAVRSGGTSATLPDGITAALDRILYFAQPPTYRIDAEIDGSALCLMATAAEGFAEERIALANVKGSGGKFAINGRYLRDALTEVGRNVWVPPGGGPSPSVAYFASDDRKIEHLIMLLA